MNLKRLEYFLVVVEEGSISAAAQRLHLTQPPLSQAIRALETELGARLLERRPRGVAPTEAGRQLARDGAQLLQWTDKIAHRIREVGEGRAGSLQVASVPTFAWTHLTPLLRAYRGLAPDVSVELSDPDPAGVLGMVAEGRADVGFVATADVSRLASAFPGLHVRFLVDLPLVLVVSSGRHVAGLRDLESETWIVPAAIQGFPGLDELTDQFWRRNDVTPARIQQVSTLQTALPLIAADMAVGLLPRDGFEVVGGQVAAIDLALDIPPLRAAMVWSAEMQPAPSLDLLFQVIDQAVADAAI